MKTICKHGHDLSITRKWCGDGYRCGVCRYRTEQRTNTARIDRWRKRHPAQYKTETNDRIRQKREAINRLKMAPCKDCGVQYSPWVMTFDHRDPSRKEKNVSQTFCSWSLDHIKREIEKCDLVCSNCHAERTHRQRAAGLFRRSARVEVPSHAISQ